VRQVRIVGATLVACGLAASAAVATLARPSSSHAGRITPADAIFVPSGPALPGETLPSPPCNHLCYSPAQLQAAYDWPTGPHAPTGAGQTIVVAVAFGSPTIESDLAAFDTMFGLPPTTIEYCGAPNTGSDNSDLEHQWGPETSADVEYAHAMAPGAQIVLLVSPTDDFGDMATTQAECLPKYPGAILVQAFGEDEIDANDPAVAADFDALHQNYVAVTDGGGTVIAASGDFGATGVDCDPTQQQCGTVAEYPASDPLVTAVGGTEGNPYPDGLLAQPSPPSGGDEGGQQSGDGGGAAPPPVETPPPVQGKVKPPKIKPPKPPKPPKVKHFGAAEGSGGAYGGEQVWNESELLSMATGGAPSMLYATPDYQKPFNDSPWRTTSDVAYDAAAQGGEAVIWNGILGGFAGTSIGPAHWAALVALANELRAGWHQDSIGELNPALYAIAGNPDAYARDFHDITIGNNSDGGAGFDAGPGYDLPTGLGTPDVSHLIADLAVRPSKHDDVGDTIRQKVAAHIAAALARHHFHAG
jgi:subtilase family serine protease